MKISLENDECQFTIETNTIDNTSGIDPQGTEWTLREKFPGERWDSENGETAWRKQ